MAVLGADDWMGVMQTWAAFSADLTTSCSNARVDWTAAVRMIDAVRPKLEADARRLRELLEQSRKILAPLGEPFDLDLGLHRWLDGEREEAYSDWLEWVVRQARTAGRVFGLFGQELPKDIPHGAVLTTKREVCVEEGHEEYGGRLDLVVYYDDRALLVIEVKKGDADSADTGKHVGYKKSHPLATHVLLANAGELADYEGFQFCTWADTCIAMRHLAVDLKNQEIMAAAMVLAFVAAVEQNLLGFSSAAVRGICDGTHLVFSGRVVDHIERFLAKSGGSNGL